MTGTNLGRSSWNRLKSLDMAPRTAKDRAAVLRRKLVNNEMNPFVDILLSMLILFMSPFIALTAFMHDKMMYNFLNKTYIYRMSIGGICGASSSYVMLLVRVDYILRT